MPLHDLSPMPCADPSRSSMDAAPGFVDDTAVLALLFSNADCRSPHGIENLALAADEMDYAGWPPGLPHARRV